MTGPEKDRLSRLENLVIGIDGENGLRGTVKILKVKVEQLDKIISDHHEFVAAWQDNLKNLKRLMWLGLAALISAIIANFVKIKTTEDSRELLKDSLSSIQSTVEDAIKPGQP
jgi:glutamate mutase epsilon subunit